MQQLRLFEEKTCQILEEIPSALKGHDIFCGMFHFIFYLKETGFWFTLKRRNTPLARGVVHKSFWTKITIPPSVKDGKLKR
jgi:hypothetical protein